MITLSGDDKPALATSMGSVGVIAIIPANLVSTATDDSIKAAILSLIFGDSTKLVENLLRINIHRESTYAAVSLNVPTNSKRPLVLRKGGSMISSFSSVLGFALLMWNGRLSKESAMKLLEGPSPPC